MTGLVTCYALKWTNNRTGKSEALRLRKKSQVQSAMLRRSFMARRYIARRLAPPQMVAILQEVNRTLANLLASWSICLCR